MYIIPDTLNHTVRKKNKYWYDIPAKGTMFGDLTYRLPICIIICRRTKWILFLTY